LSGVVPASANIPTGLGETYVIAVGCAPWRATLRVCLAGSSMW
jgi:hypothetical protein